MYILARFCEDKKNETRKILQKSESLSECPKSKLKTFSFPQCSRLLNKNIEQDLLLLSNLNSDYPNEQFVML